MAFWHQIGKSNLKTLCIQFRRCCTHLPHASFLNSTPKPRPIEIPHPYSFFHGRPTSVYYSVRFFAAPIQFQVKSKQEEDNTSGPRLNDQIKAQYVRLVIDDGHSIVSRFEALERARRLKLDLVEVQKNANPPVCKIMDYHKETYKRQEKDKERAKSKSEVTLRRECKEVRFSEKTELKDLKMKADMVKKLMEKGYRVKCRATGNEDQDLTGSLSRLLALIEDVCVVESGPHMVRKEAFAIVRHVKYGPSKKGGRKSQDAAALMAVKAEEGSMENLTADSSDSIAYENQSSAESVFGTEEEVLSDGDKHISFSVGRSDENIKDRNDSVSPVVFENRYRRADHPVENKVRSNTQVPPPVETENRYKRAEPRNRFQQTSNNTGPGIRDAGRRIPSNLNHTRHVPVDINVNSKIENTKQAINVNSKIENTKQAINVIPGSRNSMPSHDNMSRHPRAPDTPSPGYGIFSNTKGPETQGVTAGMHRNREGNYQDSTRQPFSRNSQ